MKQADKPSNYRWVVMGLWLFANVAGFMVMTSIGALLPAIDADLGLSPSQLGVLGSVAFWGNVTLAIPLSWWVSRYSAKLLTTVTLTLETLILFLQGWAPVFTVLRVGHLAFGIAVVAGHPARAILTQEWFPPREIGMVNSVSNALFGLVVGVGQLATPFILASTEDNWRTTLYIFGALFAVLTILWIVLGRERVTATSQRTAIPQDVNVLKGALTYRDLWIAGLGFLGASLALSGFLSFFPTLMLDTYNIPLQWSGGILALSIFMGGVAGLGFGYLSMNTGKGRVILQTIGLLMVVTYVGMTLTSSLPVLFALSFLNGVAWGFWPILFTVSFHLPGIRPREVAVAVSFTMMMSSEVQPWGL
jgi:MFS transporter, Spinster family, sphingosine-1-phosphate transporter